jgi:intracellular septation protein
VKLLLDFLPIILFFVAFKWAEGHPDLAAGWGFEHLGFLIQSGVVTPDVAPVLLATLVVMVASGAQVSLLLAGGRRVDPMLWMSLALVVVLGAATVWFHSETFIKWKPTLLYWAMGSALLLGLWVWKRNFLQSLLGAQMKLPEAVWTKLNVAWALFFLAMGGLNLWVAYEFDTASWVNFKLFGGMGLLVAFSVAQAIWVSRHLIEEPEATP